MITPKLFKSFSFHASLLLAGALSACGGSGSTDITDTTAAPADSSTKLERSAKASGSASYSSYEQAAQSLYVAYFGRPADQTGLTALEQELAAANAPAGIAAIDSAYAANAKLKQVVDQLGNSTESARLYGMGSDSPAQLVSAVFQHVLQRSPSQSETAKWVATLGSKGYGSTRLPLDVMATAINGGVQSTDALALGNRIAFATSFTQQLAQHGSKSYSGISALAAARTTMARIDHTASASLQSSKVEDAIGALDAAPTRKLLVSRKAVTTTAYYVSPTGNNANPGTQTSPWKTVQYGVSKLSAGQTLYAMSGVYAETVAINASGTSAAPITVTAYPGQSPVIDGATVVVGNYASLVKLHGNYITFSGFEVRNINNDGHGGNGGSATVLDGYGVSVEGNNNTVSNLNVHNTWAQGILASGNNALIENNTVSYVAMSNCRAANTANCSSTSRGWASCLSAASPYGSSQITYNAVIQGNTVFNCWGEGISTWLSNGTVIQNNVTYNNWAENMYVNNAWNTLVQRNVIYNTPNNYVNAMAPFSMADEQTNTTANTHSAYPTVINNLLYNSPFCGFCWTLVNGTGLYGGMIANNTVVATALPAGVSAFSTGGAGNSKNVVNVYSFIYNNLVSGAGYVPSAGGLTLSNNLWSIKPSTPAAIGANDVIGQNPQLAQSGSTSAGQLSSGYFQPLATSPALGKGKSITTVATDFVGSVMGAPPNIGGYQTTAL